MSKKMKEIEKELVNNDLMKEMGDELISRGYEVEYWSHDECSVSSLIIIDVRKKLKVSEDDMYGYDVFFSVNDSELHDLFDEVGIEALWREGWNMPEDSLFIDEYDEWFAKGNIKEVA